MSESKFERALSEYMCGEGEALMLENEDIAHEFSPEFEKRMEKLINRRKKPYFRMINTVGKRVACIAACTFIVSAGALMSVDAVRDAVFGFIMNIFEDHSDISFEDDGKHPDTIQDIYEITYDMSEYSIDFKDLSERSRTIVYTDNDKEITYMQYTQDALNMMINTEDAVISHIDINGFDAIYYCDNHNYHTLIWDNGQYIFYISSNLSKEETISIAESVKKVESK